MANALVTSLITTLSVKLMSYMIPVCFNQEFGNEFVLGLEILAIWKLYKRPIYIQVESCLCEVI